MANSVTDNSGAVTDNPGKMRYEIHEGAEVAGFISYGREGKVIIFLHTEDRPPVPGRGPGRVPGAGLATTPGSGGSPCCPSARSSGDWIAGHREYADLVPAPRRAEFGL